MSRIAEDHYARTGAYPKAPGWKEPTTSRDAALSIKGVDRIQQAVLKAILDRGAGGATADEAAADLKMSVLTVRPRVTELGSLHFIVKTGGRRPNQSGRSAIVWRGK